MRSSHSRAALRSVSGSVSALPLKEADSGSSIFMALGDYRQGLEMRACHIAVLSYTHNPTPATRSGGGEGRCWGQSAKYKRSAK